MWSCIYKYAICKSRVILAAPRSWYSVMLRSITLSNISCRCRTPLRVVSRRLSDDHSAQSSAAYCLDLVRLGRCKAWRWPLPPTPFLHLHVDLKSPDHCFPPRRFDHDHYLCCLLLPREARAAGLALRALNVELAQVILYSEISIPSSAISSTLQKSHCLYINNTCSIP